ncbi:MAG: thioredoxin [Bacteroidales bacterium]|nr:thioredoxin [Bacteroidales bacterium]
MKPIIIITSLLFVFTLAGCQQKNQNGEANAGAANTEQSGNPYISDTQAQDTPVLEEDLSGKVIMLSASEFVERITDINDDKGFSYKGVTPCIVDFYADWCGPCRQLHPLMERMAEKYKGKLIIYKINVDRAHDVCERFGIQSIPTLIFFKRTEAPAKIVGAPSESELETAITDFLNK